MRSKGIVIFVIASLCLINSSEALAACPSADFSVDCFVDFEDFAVIGAQWLNLYDWNDVNTLANQWLTGYPNIPDDMVYIPDGNFVMGDHFSPEGHDDELPLHDVLLDSFFMSKYEVTNQQYCDYLNSAYDACDIWVNNYGNVYAFSDSSNSYPYCATHTIYNVRTQIDYNEVSGTFSVRTKGEPPRDMSNDPMVTVCWYGAAAYCNWRSGEEGYQQCYDINDPNWQCDFSKNGYRLPTEAEWEYAARGGLSGRRFPWGDTINHDYANYRASGGAYAYDTNPYTIMTFHPTWNDGIWPYTSPVGSFSPNGYGLYDMSGNVLEWCNDWYSDTYYSSSPLNNPTGPTSGTCRVLRSGCWYYLTPCCRVVYRTYEEPPFRSGTFGFRLSLDLE